MMFGLGESFDYFECSKCGCLQIKEIPEDMSKYYPSEKYYSFEKPKQIHIKEFFFKKRNEYALFNKGIIGKILYQKSPYPFLRIMGDLKLDKNLKILDVGCGNGYLLYSLHRQGFINLIGLDPNINKETFTETIKIFKKEIFEISEDNKFDLIILSHSFEHMPQQLDVLQKINKILSKDGICIIAMPLKTKYIWEFYGTNWVQIDAPRHFFIHTLKSFRFLIKNTDLVLKDVIFNSDDFQFWGSEQYKKGIKLEGNNSYLKNPKKSIFNQKEIKKFKKRAEDLNKIKQGDQAVFLLKRELK